MGFGVPASLISTLTRRAQTRYWHESPSPSPLLACNGVGFHRTEQKGRARAGWHSTTDTAGQQPASSARPAAVSKARLGKGQSVHRLHPFCLSWTPVSGDADHIMA